MNEATQITMPYTIAVYMVRDFLGPDASQAQISRLTGVLVRVISFSHLNHNCCSHAGLEPHHLLSVAV